MKIQLATLLFLVLASSKAAKYFHPFHHYHQEKEAYSDNLDGDSTGLLEKMAARLQEQARQVEGDSWEHGPPLYYFTDFDPPGASQEKFADDFRPKRKGPSLSIVNPLEVLQEKWLLEMSRKQKAKSRNQMQRNREILSSIGKRSIPENSDSRSFINEFQHSNLQYQT